MKSSVYYKDGTVSTLIKHMPESPKVIQVLTFSLFTIRTSHDKNQENFFNFTSSFLSNQSRKLFTVLPLSVCCLFSLFDQTLNQNQNQSMKDTTHARSPVYFHYSKCPLSFFLFSISITNNLYKETRCNINNQLRVKGSVCVVQLLLLARN